METQNLKTKKVTVGEEDFEVVSFKTLADLLGRTTMALRKLEYKEILPKPNLRSQPLESRGHYRKGDRLYTIELAYKLKEIFSEIKSGVPVSEEQRRQISLAFKEELQCLNG